MSSTKQYLQVKIEPCVHQLFQHYLPSQSFKSIHDLFNVQKFHKLLTCILSEQTKSKIPDVKLMDDSDHNVTYNQMRRRNFNRILEIIGQSYEVLGLSMGRRVSVGEINEMVQSTELGTMTVMMQYIFELLKHNKEILQFITTLDGNIQNNIMQVMENSQMGGYNQSQNLYQQKDGSVGSLTAMSRLKRMNQGEASKLSELQQVQSHMQQLQSQLQVKDQQVKQLKFSKEQVQEQLEQTKRQLNSLQQQLQQLKKRLMSYQQIDQLMIQKDEQIIKLTKKLTDHQLKSRLKQSSLTNQNKHLLQRTSHLQTINIEVMNKYQKQKLIIEQLTKQKEEIQMSMKKVINNLKEKNKNIMEKVGDLQTELTQLKFQKEIKEKQLNQYKLIHQGRKIQTQMIFDDLNSPRSPLRSEINEGIQSLTGNYSRLGQQLSLELDRADLQDQLSLVQKPSGNKRFNQLLQENYSLKQQLQKSNSHAFIDSKQAKQLQDQIHKMKKKINILKRRNDDIENLHKDEIDIMVGVMEQCYIHSFQTPTNKK